MKEMVRVLQAVLFDMDGLLLDSERLWLEAEAEVMAWLGGSWGPEHQEFLVGGSLDRTVAYMLELTGIPATPEEVGRRLLDAMAERLRADVPLMPGARDLLDEVRAAGLPSALVSSTHRALMEHALDGLGRDSFTVTVAGDEVSRTKPHPEPYLAATRLLDVDPRRCVALEDSLNGATSGAAAGCHVVAVPSVVPIDAAPRRTVVTSLREIDLDRLRALI
ncbi:HAD family phosphatase [Actinoallomurus vinaceus]|uniref:HAD family hydrolase n=1 Tax=Actinoallomurus vinaceus TaxID=1080074 RepID=UPI0031ED2E35